VADRPFPVSRRLLLRAAVLGPLAAALDAAARRAGAAPPARHTHRTIIGVI
jgi:hypothetical protein